MLVYLKLISQMYFLCFINVIFFMFGMSKYIEIDSYFLFSCLFIAALFLLLMLKNIIYFKIGKKILKIKENELIKETKFLSEEGFLKYIDKQKNIPLKNKKTTYGLGYLSKELIYRKRVNKKTMAIEYYEKIYKKPFQI